MNASHYIRETPLSRAARAHGMTLFEVLIAMSIMLVGIVGVLMAIPSGVNSATTVICQDSAIQLAHSKFAEFRRDRVDPGVELSSAAYLGPVNTSPGGAWRDFPHGAGEAYEYFADIERYEWTIEIQPITRSAAGNPPPPPNIFFPVTGPAGGGTDLELYQVGVVVRMKGTAREFRFTQLMYSYGRITPYDPAL